MTRDSFRRRRRNATLGVWQGLMSQMSGLEENP
jgi:hypothetical protein